MEDGDGIVMKGDVSRCPCPDEGIVAGSIGEASAVKVTFAWRVNWMEGDGMKECVC